MGRSNHHRYRTCPAEKRARYAALVQLGSPVGTLLSTGAFALVLLLPNDAVMSWGWRLPLLAVFPLLAVALWIRLKVEESPVFEQLAEMDDRPKVPAPADFTKAPIVFWLPFVLPCSVSAGSI